MNHDTIKLIVESIIEEASLCDCCWNTDEKAVGEYIADEIRALLPSLIEKYGTVDKDAERYRFIRDVGATFYTGLHTINETEHHVCEFAMDDVIDTAIANEKG